MKKLLIILLLIVGCDNFGVFNHDHENYHWTCYHYTNWISSVSEEIQAPSKNIYHTKAKNTAIGLCMADFHDPYLAQFENIENFESYCECYEGISN